MSRWRVAVGYTVASVLVVVLVAIPMMPLWQSWFGTRADFRDYTLKTRPALIELFKTEGPAAVAAAVRSEASALADGQFIVFADPGRKVLSGTLSTWPAEIPDASVRETPVWTDPDSKKPTLMVWHDVLPGGYHLLIGRKAVTTGSNLLNGAVGAIVILVLFSAGGAWLLARRAREARKANERYERVVLASDAGLWDYGVAKDEYYVSPAMLELCGLPPGTTFSGREDFMQRAPWVPEDRERFKQAVQQLFDGGGSRLSMEVRYLHGEETRWVKLDGMCFRDAAGKVERWAGSATDVTERKRAEESLRETQDRFALAVAGSDDGIWDVDFAAQRVFVSVRTRELTGMPPGPDIVPFDEGFACWSIHPEDMPRRAAALQAHLEGTTPAYVGEFRLRQLDGVYRWRRLHGLCSRDADGKPLRIAGSISDIDARRRAEDALRLSEERYALALEAAEEGHFDSDLETNQNFASARTNEIYGFPRQATVASRLELLAKMPIHPDDRHIVDELSKSGWGDPVVDLQEIEFRIVPRPGEIRWIHSRAKIVRDDQGRPRRRVGVVADITDRKLAEEALREQTERLQLGQAAMRMIIMDWNVAEDLLAWSDSPEWLRGPMPASGHYPLFNEQIHPDDRDSFLATRQRALETLQVQTTEFRLVRTDGEVIWVLERKYALAGVDGKAARLLAAMVDITDRKRAEEALRRSEAALRLSEERYALALEASEEGHFDNDLESGEIFTSARLNEIYGFPPQAKTLNRIEYLNQIPFHPDDRHVRADLSRPDWQDPAGNLYEIECRIVPRPGETRWIHSRAKVVRDAEGRPRRRIGVVADITERKNAEDALRESEMRFRGLTELWSDWYWRQDENLRFDYSSASGQYPTGDAIGKTRWELPGVVALSSSWAEHREQLMARKPFRDFEYSRPAGDGTVRYVSVSGTPIFDDKGVFRGYHGVARNITERKRIEEELRSRKEMLELAQKAARAVAYEWRIRANKEENQWSPDLEAMFGLPPGAFDGSAETWKKLVHSEDRPLVKRAIRHALRSGDIDLAYRVVHPDGSVHWLESKGRVFFDANGEADRMVGFMQDVTQRKVTDEELRKMELELRRAQRLEAMGTLAGGIAHDFNNILGAILGYGEMATRDAKKGSRLRRDLDSIMAAGERGRALVDRVLAFSRSGIADRVPVHVEAVVREALDQVAASLPANVTIIPSLRAGRAAMLGDPTQVHQVVMNLATNAVQAMPQGGVLRVTLETPRIEAPLPATVGSVTPGDYIALRVTDSGSGIPDNVLERMFDPFFTTKEVGVGSGLGLSLVHGIVTSVGGAIHVQTRIGKGSSFTVYLRRSGDARDKPANENRPLPRGAGQRVLVVDDEEPLVLLTTETLERLGYAPVGFTSSVNALQEFGANPGHFDAILTDERMPVVTGSMMIEEVRRIDATIPILLMSGFVSAATALKARELGANDVLKKPLLARELAASLARALRP